LNALALSAEMEALSMAASRLATGFALILTAALLASCGGSQSSALQPATTSTFFGPAPGAVVSHVGNETLIGHQTSYTWKCVNANVTVTFSAAGNASGPYSGTFTASGKFFTYEYKGCQGPGPAGFSQTFNIASGSNSINGTLAGHGRYNCYTGGCNAGGWASYKATLYRHGKLRKSFSGNGSAQGGYDGVNDTWNNLF
jgi:hypothetical protein